MMPIWHCGGVSAEKRLAEKRSSLISCIVFHCCAKPRISRIPHHMVDIAQPVEHLIVVQKVARSSRVIHPINPGFARGWLFFRPCARDATARVVSSSLLQTGCAYRNQSHCLRCSVWLRMWRHTQPYGRLRGTPRSPDIRRLAYVWAYAAPRYGHIRLPSACFRRTVYVPAYARL